MFDNLIKLSSKKMKKRIKSSHSTNSKTVLKKSNNFVRGLVI